MWSPGATGGYEGQELLLLAFFRLGALLVVLVNALGLHDLFGHVVYRLVFAILFPLDDVHPEGLVDEVRAIPEPDVLVDDGIKVIDDIRVDAEVELLNWVATCHVHD